MVTEPPPPSVPLVKSSLGLSVDDVTVGNRKQNLPEKEAEEQVPEDS